MVAGQSVKLKSGFKLNSGATFKVKVDPTNPTLKSSSIEKLYAPVIVGDKNATIKSMYSIGKQFGNEDVEWLLFGNDFEYSCKTDNFTLPADLKKWPVYACVQDKFKRAGSVVFKNHCL